MGLENLGFNSTKSGILDPRLATPDSDGLTPSQVAVERSLDILETSWKMGVEQITTDIREIDEKLEANFNKFNEKFALIRSKLGAKLSAKTKTDATRIQWRTALVDFTGALEDRVSFGS